MREVPRARELDIGEAHLPADRPHALDALEPALDPAVRPEATVVVLVEGRVRLEVAPEEPAVVDHSRDDGDVRGGGGVEDQLARPRLERVQDHHRPVDHVAEALEAGDEVQGEAVGGAGRDADRAGQPVVAKRGHGLPDRGRLVAGAVRVVEEENVEEVDADGLEAPLGRLTQVAGVVRPARAGPGR